jgi:hypothetical protein
MKKDELKLMITISIAMSIVVGIIYFIITNSKVELVTLFRAFSSGLTAVTFFWLFYFKYGWKWWGFKKIFYRPNLNGTWGGELISDYIREDGTKVEPMDFYIVIRQNFLKIHFTTFTDNFVGKSYSETFSLNEDEGLKNLSYLYRKDTSQVVENLLNEGAAELRVIESEINKMEGKYWTNVKTTGLLNVSYITCDQLDSFEDCTKAKKNGK